MSDALNGNIHGPVVAATEEGDESASFGLSVEVTKCCWRLWWNFFVFFIDCRDRRRSRHLKERPKIHQSVSCFKDRANALALPCGVDIFASRLERSTRSIIRTFDLSFIFCPLVTVLCCPRVWAQEGSQSACHGNLNPCNKSCGNHAFRGGCLLAILSAKACRSESLRVWWSGPGWLRLWWATFESTCSDKSPELLGHPKRHLLHIKHLLTMIQTGMRISPKDCKFPVDQATTQKTQCWQCLGSEVGQRFFGIAKRPKGMFSFRRIVRQKRHSPQPHVPRQRSHQAKGPNPNCTGPDC